MEPDEQALRERIRTLLRADGYQHPADAFFLTSLESGDGYLPIARNWSIEAINRFGVKHGLMSASDKLGIWTISPMQIEAILGSNRESVVRYSREGLGRRSSDTGQT
jgi:hypothetical protein